jgi:glycine/D-amino acid oxidase-like deaminating enzyme
VNDTHPSPWVRQASALPQERLPRPNRCDVAIVGGGIAGIATALHLARAGVGVVVLEARAVATRASGRNDGQLLLGLGEHYNRIVGQFGPDQARALWGFIRDNNTHLKDELRRCVPEFDLVDAGGLRLAQTPHEQQELAQAAELLAQEGIAHELLDAGALRQVLPPATGFFGALHLPGEAIVQPVRMVRGLARAARAAGALVYEGVAVTALEPGADGVRLRLHDGSTLTAPVAVLCTSALACHLDETGFLRQQVFPFRGQVLASDPLPGDIVAPFGRYAMSSNFCYEYFRTFERRFVIGGMRWSVKGQEEGTIDDDVTNPQVTANLLGYVARHFPSLQGVTFPTVWTGIMAGTGDGLPLLGALPGRPGVFVHLAFNGYGLSFAFEGGAVLAQQILEGKSAHPAADLFAPRRFA